LHSEGKKVILVVDNILPEHTALLNKISGFVALNGDSATEHIAAILETHGIAALIGDSDRVFKIESSDGGHALKRSAREGDDTSSYILKFVYGPACLQPLFGEPPLQKGGAATGVVFKQYPYV
jgi:hypothetical protein